MFHAGGPTHITKLLLGFRNSRLIMATVNLHEHTTICTVM
jgi:hypothetical protein